MSDRIIPNHLRVYRDRTGKHVTLDGHELLLAEDGLFLDGVENPDDVTRVQITLQAPKITVESELHDQPAPVPAPPATLADELRSVATGVATLDIGVQSFFQDKDKAYRGLRDLADRVEAGEEALDKAQQDAIDAWEHVRACREALKAVEE